jgi:nicotinamide-nucleotide amidase
MKAEIVSIGSELVSGQGLDTNSQWLSRSLADVGIPAHFHTTLGDDLEDNVSAFRIAAGRADLVLATGGLGPTQDDLTREALAQAAEVPLIEDPTLLEAIAAIFARINRPMAPRNRVQALIPQGAEPLPNRVGTAPGIWMKIGQATFTCLPGVPSEMRIMYDEQVVPRLRRQGWIDHVIIHRKINLFGRGESDVEAGALDLTIRGRNPEVGITAHDATISFRISTTGSTEEEARQTMEPTLILIRERFGQSIVGEGDEDVAEGLVAQLARTRSTLATAESCTGGLIAHLITRIPSVSPYYPGGVVSYANSAKVELLGVSQELLDAHGAVSAQVAEAMAVGVRERLRADVGLSVTGIAGPGGATTEKPVGLIYLGLADAQHVQSRRLDLGSLHAREFLQLRAAKSALNWARLALLER